MALPLRVLVRIPPEAGAIPLRDPLDRFVVSSGPSVVFVNGCNPVNNPIRRLFRVRFRRASGRLTLSVDLDRFKFGLSTIVGPEEDVESRVSLLWDEERTMGLTLDPAFFWCVV